MRLKELTINGFKSFAKRGELEFSAPITAIVGPNGSGKSNVAEAFRFVLGEQSVKSMRGKRGEDLIWGGSEKVSRGNRAAVRVLLDNRARTFPVDFDELTIERVVHRDGQNEYSLNGSKVRLKDVQEVLAAANIGPTGHHIISQGEADRILSASAKERREMIEDALGLKVYQFKKQEAEKKLQKTRANIEQVQSLRREVAPHLKYLERQVKKIEKSLEVQTELKSTYVEYLKREDTYLAFHFDRLTEARLLPASKLAALDEQLTAAKARLEKTEASAQKDALLAAERALQAAGKARQEVVKRVGQLEGQLDFLTRRVREAEQRAKEVKVPPVPFSTIERVVATIEQDVEKAVGSGEPQHLRRALLGVVHTLKLFLKRTSETDAPAPGQERDREELAALEAQLADAQAAYEEAQAAEEAARQGYQALQHEIESEADESRAAERAIFEIVNERREMEAQLERIDRELSVLERDRAEFKRELQEAVSLIGSGVSGYYAKELYADGEAVTTEAIAAEDRDVQRQRRMALEKLKIRLEELGVGATDEVLKEYEDTRQRDAFLEREIADLEASAEKLGALIADLSAQLNERFVAGIEKITAEFNKFFVLMFGGGSASLALVQPKKRAGSADTALLEDGEVVLTEEDEAAEEGIELQVSLPNKRVKGLEMLSGGERALTSIALIFAMSQVNPPLFIILDETDAALDEANSRRYGDMIEALAKKSQLILITHNRETMSRAGILYGVTMAGDGVSKLLSVRFEEAAAVAKA